METSNEDWAQLLVQLYELKQNPIATLNRPSDVRYARLIMTFQSLIKVMKIMLETPKFNQIYEFMKNINANQEAECIMIGELINPVRDVFEEVCNLGPHSVLNIIHYNHFPEIDAGTTSEGEDESSQSDFQFSSSSEDEDINMMNDLDPHRQHG